MHRKNLLYIVEQSLDISRLRFSDGTGGCNGCLNNQHMGLEQRQNCSLGADNSMLPNAVKTDNAGLELTADILEEIFTNPDFPPAAAKLAESLAQSGKSRADLWNFAQAVAVERGINNNNDLCDEVSCVTVSGDKNVVYICICR